MPDFRFHPVASDDRTYRLTCRANEYFERHHYKEAIVEYTKTIMAMGPSDGKDRQSATDFTALIYSNRSASYCMLKQWADAENDAAYVMKIRPNWAKVREVSGFLMSKLSLIFCRRALEGLVLFGGEHCSRGIMQSED
ncbi:hypothetical protein BC936DRAFT_139985 [Jimgerdemannia flammicorona]|uniref:Uncharacterized protein n=1 Tax=Jimgerdemannia flammicorona TaxID=994334 RepID=A0A433B918_9FUNG|nr:hypothetical protein BC936DRAFT_139985 [Jimgerdemannia flammicorona]